MANNGWIKLHRKILDNDSLYGSSLTFAIFATLLLMADTDGKVVIGRFQLATRFRAKPSTIYKTLRRLQSNNQVTLQSNNKSTTVSICKWKEYQNKVTPKVTAKEQQSNTPYVYTRIENKEDIILTDVNNNIVVPTKEELKPEEDYKSLPSYQLKEVWKDTFGKNPTGGQKLVDFPFNRLVKAYGQDSVERVVKALGSDKVMSDDFFPSVNNPYQLEQKWIQVVKKLQGIFNKKKGITSV